MKALAIIFANSYDHQIHELVTRRTTASIPFAGRYRLIDFTLSNLVNSNVTKVGVYTLRNYQSLMNHLGSGKDWDLDRRNDGLTLFPPFAHYNDSGLSKTRLEDLQSIMSYLNKCQEEQVILINCESVALIDYNKILEQHVTRNADMTLIYQECEVTKDIAKHMTLVLDENERVMSGSSLTGNIGKKANVSINIMVINRKLLHLLVSEALARGATDFNKEVILDHVPNLMVYGYRYNGIYMLINTMENYYKCSMQLLDPNVRNELFNTEHQTIYTRVGDSTPTCYGPNAEVINSFIADGCDIQGKVVNSILFRGVKVGKNTVVEDSIIFQDTTTGEHVHLKGVISDADTVIRDRRELIGCPEIPYYIGKNLMV